MRIPLHDFAQNGGVELVVGCMNAFEEYQRLQMFASSCLNLVLRGLLDRKKEDANKRLDVMLEAGMHVCGYVCIYVCLYMKRRMTME